jgi:hypothetical protein
MKKYLIPAVILVVIVAAVITLLSRTPEGKVQPVVTDFPEPAPGAIVFDMKYRGLSGAKDELRVNAYSKFGQNGKDTPFIKEVRKQGGELSTVYNPHFKGAEWSAIEVKDNKTAAFYFDLNADGKVSENEKILPIEMTESDPSNRTEFVTPDFMMTTRSGHKVQFRALLQVTFYGQTSRPNFMWSPSCVLEGTSTFNGKPTRLTLFGNGFTCDFDKFGSCSYALQNSEEQSGRYISRHNLSRIINYKGQFYNLKLSGSYEKDKRIQVNLKEYAGATGELAIQLNGDTNLNSRLSYARIVGFNDITISFETMSFDVPSEQTKLPVGAYELNRGYINYGVKKKNEWQLDFKKGPEFTIEADKTCKVELGKPVLLVSAVDENKRYQNDVKEQTVYSEGTNIYISRIIKGKGSELYGRFSRQDENFQSHNAIEPDIKIADSEGKEVAAAKIKYG